MTILSARQLSTQRDLVANAPLYTYSQEDLGGMMQKIFPSIRSGLRAFINFFETDKGGTTQSLTGTQHAFLRELAGKSYGDIYSISMPVPQGLNAPYLSYLDVLEEAANFACAEVPEVLNEYSTYLAGLVSTNHAMMESTSLNVQYVKQGKLREDLTERMAACLNGGTVASRPIKEVVKRNNDWEKVIARTDALLMRMIKIDRSELNRKIQSANELFDLLGKRISSGEMADISPEVILHLSDGAYHLGENLQFFAVLYFRVSVLSETVAADIAHLTQTFASHRHND